MMNCFTHPENCHICGEFIETWESMNQIEAIEAYTVESGQVHRTVKTQWHVECHTWMLDEWGGIQ